MSRSKQVPCPYILIMQDWIYIIKVRVLSDPAPVTEEEVWKFEQRLGRGGRSDQSHIWTTGAAQIFYVEAAKGGEIYALIVVSSVFADSRTDELPGQQISGCPYSSFLYPVFSFHPFGLVLLLQVTVLYNLLTNLIQQRLKPALILAFSSGLKCTQHQNLPCL